jgi:hypothetical protein
MAVLNSFTAGETISSDDMDENFTDFASEITGSLPRDGQAGMTGQFKAASGTEGAPGIAFSSSTDTGLRRSAGGTMAIVAGGSDVAVVTSTAITMESGTTIAAQALTLATALAVAQGGTGAASASAAATNLGLGTGDSPQFTAINLSHASANTLTASSGDLSIEGNVVYRAGGTDVPVTDGGTGSSSASGARTNLGVAYASQANMEARDSGVVVTPDIQVTHPGHPKCWAFVTTSGGTPTLQNSYNVSSITDTAQGRLTITIDTDFSSANWAATCTIEGGNSGGGNQSNVETGGHAAGSTLLQCYNGAGGSAGSLSDPPSWHFSGFGDLP